MRLLLDSNILIWSIYDPAQLSRVARALLEDEANQLLVSHASLWELLAKIGRGHLSLAGVSVDDAMERFVAFGVIFLPVETEHIVEAAHLPHYHSDPFDRVIIAQARLMKIPVVASDGMFRKYSVQVLW